MKTICKILPVLLLCGLLVSCQSTARPALTVVFLDVGQGNATLVRVPEGDILVDCGPESAQETLCRKLKDYGVQTLEFLILTHQDEDHIGGADVILQEFGVKQILSNGAAGTGESYTRLMEMATLRKIPITAVDKDDEAKLGELSLYFLHPFSKTEVQAGNSGSLVFRLTCGERSVLFMGDAETNVEKRLLQQTPNLLAADVLHVGHHGSASSCGPEFLQAVSPALAVISCGRANIFGYPDGRVLANLQAVGATVLRTDQTGDIQFTVEDGEWNW